MYVVSTTVHDGDFAVAQDIDVVGPRRDAITANPWTWLRQVHGADVVEVTRPGEHAGAVADAVVTACVGAPIAVTTADCSPVVLVSTRGIGVAHAGWKGLVAGVIEETAAALRSLGGDPTATLLGPCIHPDRYEFGEDDLRSVADRYGSDVRGRTVDGRLALDVPAAVRGACAAAGWPEPDTPACTSGEDYFSHRTRGDGGRQTTVAWISS